MTTDARMFSVKCDDDFGAAHASGRACGAGRRHTFPVSFLSQAMPGDGLAVIEALLLPRVQACKPPHTSVPKPGPCRGHRRRARGTTARTAPRRYTGPSVTYTPAQRAAIAEYKRLRDAEHDPAHARQVGQIRDQLARARAALGPVMLARAAQEYRIEAAVDRWARAAPDGPIPPEQARQRMQQALRELFANKQIATRISAEGLSAVLREGRFKTQFETGASGLPGGYVPEERAQAEEKLFGIPQQGFDPAKRPYYGYVALSGPDTSPAQDGALNVYGPIAVIFHDRVRQRTTAMIGDSLNDADAARPSPVNDPQFWSFKPGRLRPGDFDHDPAGPDFRHGAYAEAQIHGGLDVADIAQVVFPDPPSPGLAAQLDHAGVPWQVRPPG